MEQLGLTDGAQRAVGDPFAGDSCALELHSGGGSNVQAMPPRLLIRQQGPCIGQGSLVGDRGADGLHHLVAHLVAGAADGRAQGNHQILPPGPPLHQPIQGRDQDSSRHPPPTGMTGRGMPGAGIRDQNRCAVGTAHPEALAPAITHQAIGLRPGILRGVAGVQNDSTVDLLGPVDADAGADVPRQFIRTTAVPEPGEEAVLEPLPMQQIALEVIAPVTTDPGPALQRVEAAVWSIKRPVFHQPCNQAMGMSRSIQKPPKVCSSGLDWMAMNWRPRTCCCEVARASEISAATPGSRSLTNQRSS